LCDCSGSELPLQLGELGNYWGHQFDTVITKVSVPSCGYTTLILDKKIDYQPLTTFYNDMRLQSPDVFILENEFIRASLNSLDGSIASFVDKETGIDLAPANGGFGIFRLAEEACQKKITAWNRSMSAWFTGRFKNIENLGSGVEIKPAAEGKLRNAWNLKFSFGACCENSSVIETVISLDAGSKLLRYDVTCDWREFGTENEIPNLHFYLSLDDKCSFLYDIPFGMKERQPLDMDLPGESFVLAKGSKSSLALFSTDKYAYRCLENSISLTLIRGATHPDTTPETGRHKISFAVSPVSNSASHEFLARESLVYRRPMTIISGKNKAGKTQNLEPRAGFLKFKGGVISAIKVSEPVDAAPGKKMVFRVYEVEGKAVQSELCLAYKAISACLTDVLEEKPLENCNISGDGKIVTFSLPAYSVGTLMVELE